MVLSRRMYRRLVIAGLAASFAAPVAVTQPASATILFTCDSVTGSGTVSPGLVRNQRAESFSSGPTAPAGPADIVLAGTSASGVKANGHTWIPSLSADGTKVAFLSRATNLDPRATHPYVDDVYVKDLVTGELTLASSSDEGASSNEPYTRDPTLSADGTKVAFDARATNLDPADTDLSQDIFVKNLATGDLKLVSTSDTGVKANGSSQMMNLSGDGTRVAFVSYATNLDPADTNDKADVYVKDLVTGDLVLASASDTGVSGNDHSSEGFVSADGTKVFFSSGARNLDPADTDFNYDVYVKQLATGDVTVISTSDLGVKGNWNSGEPHPSADGTKVAFSSIATNLDPGDTDTFTDVYVKDLDTGDITLGSTSDSGIKGTNNSLASWFSPDATSLAFYSRSTNLDAADTDSLEDIYIKNLVTGDITLGSASATGVKGNDASLVNFNGTSLSADGTRLAFYSYSTNLHPVDTDTLYDVYVKHLPTTPTSIAISDCSNGNSGTASVVELRSYEPRPLGCPVSLGGRPGSDYPDLTPVLLGANPSLRIDWASGPDSFGVGKLKMGTTGTQWRAVLVIQASAGHDTPATNQYLPASGSGLTKTKLKGRIDWSAVDGFNCTGGTADPISWLDLVNNGSWIVKTS